MRLGVRSRALIGLATSVTAVAVTVPLATIASAADPAPSATPRPREADDTRHVSDDITKAKVTALRKPDARLRQSLAQEARGRSGKAGAAAAVGDKKIWPALDDAKGYYAKQYTLRGVGKNIEIWVATGSDATSGGLDFPKGDCRNGTRTQVTDAQINRFISEFDTNIYPKESAFFSVPPSRDGSKATAEKTFGVPAGYWKGAGNRIVTLVDNVRDDNFYDANNAHQNTYIAGFFAGTYNGWLDRNVMTVDGYDWLHRTGDTPPNEPSQDPCLTAPGRPNLYEGTFAHEYQHLLESYVDADEVTWVNEGLSDYAQTLTGYVDTTKDIHSQGFDNHIQCLLGWAAVQTPANPNPRAACGPENSLTSWQDQGPAEILADYGAAYSFMSYLATRYGAKALTSLHRNPGNGLAGLQTVLDRVAPGARAQTVLHQWAATLALDAALDRRGTTLTGGQKAAYTSKLLSASINWDNPQAYDSQGAPPNGSDYVRLRHKQGDHVSADEIRSLTFDGSLQLPTTPVEWTVDAAARPGDPALFSGTDSNLDRAVVTKVQVPSGSPKLTFDAKWETEAGWDFGVVQVSADGGTTYKSLAATDTTSEHDPGADSTIVANLPGFTATSGGGFKTETVDLSGYAGQEVLLSFRYLSDSGTNGAGFWVDNVKVGSTVVSDGRSVAGFSTPDQLNPQPVGGWTLQLVGITANGRKAYVAKVPLTSDFTRSLSGRQVRRLVGATTGTVAAIVTQDDPAETSRNQARYTLTVNGIVQPGG
jgi:hypothetical protein